MDTKDAHQAIYRILNPACVSSCCPRHFLCNTGNLNRFVSSQDILWNLGHRGYRVGKHLFRPDQLPFSIEELYIKGSNELLQRPATREPSASLEI